VAAASNPAGGQGSEGGTVNLRAHDSDPDSLYRAGRFAEARAALEWKSATSFAALWRLARVESEMAEDATGAERRELIAWAEQHARAAVRIAPDSALSHEWLAIVLGRKALKEGPKKKLALSREIKSEADRALELNPASARAHHVRALWNRKVASLNLVERLAANTVLGGVPKGASMENAVSDLARAVELEPGFIHHRLELGRTYLQLDRVEEARRELERAASLPPGASPRDARHQEEARVLLARLPRHGARDTLPR
jgi:tetratricopeptide (TPR) repeat protein